MTLTPPSPPPEVVLLEALPGGLRGCYATDGVAAVIAVDRNLPQAERDAVILHEQLHHERGGSGHRAGAPAGWGAVVAREEARVERLVAERLAPDAVVRPLVRRLAGLGEAVTVGDVAAELGVARSVAHQALLRLRAQDRHRP